GSLQVFNEVSGPGGLTKIGDGTLQFSGFISNSYTGLTIVSNGVIEAGRTNVISIPGDVIIGDDSTTNQIATLRSMRQQQLKRDAAVTLHSSGVLDLFHINNVPQPIERLRSLTGSGTVKIGLGGRMIISNNVPFEFFGSVTGNGAVTKNGPGPMTVWGNWPMSAFSAIDIFNGDLIVQGFIDTDTNSVRSGGRLRGDGRTASQVGVAAGGGLAVDSRFPDHQGGDLQMNGLQFINNSLATTVDFDLYGPSPTGGNDKLIVDGTVRLGQATVSVNFHYPPREGDVITLLEKTTAGAIIGTFGGNLAAGLRTIGGYPVIVSYTGGDGNDLTLTVTNLPLDFFSYSLAEGNGNQTVEPDECNLLYVSVLNSGPGSLVISNAVLRAITSNAVVTLAQANYPVIASGDVGANLTPFQFRTEPSMVCGSGVEFELVLNVAGEAPFAVTFSPVSGLDCTHPTGPCESCSIVTGQFTNAPTTLQPLIFAGAPTICFPPKACPGVDLNNTVPLRYVTHLFTNSTTNELCVTAELKVNCPAAQPNALGAAAYLGSFDPAQPCLNYLGDSGSPGGTNYPPFSFRVPAGSNIVVVVTARATNLVCDTYALELFGLPCPPPTLVIAREAAPQKVRIDWSTAYPGFTAQQAGQLGKVFFDVPQIPSILNGRYALTNITANTNQFYRLIKPGGI
ncbi:MAG TPA: autotransporter-associated beta strand repeat-containing protein, partial [Verrucomicrobiae bacterium]